MTISHSIQRPNSQAPADLLTVRVLLFSVLRERIGAYEVDLLLEQGATGADLLDAFFGEFPHVGAYRPTVRLAVNAEYASLETPLGDMDEVAIITPVSGG